MRTFKSLLDRARDGAMLSPDEVMTLADCREVASMMQVAAGLRDRGHGASMSYSRKVFIPLTKLCRDSCHYCTFAQPPRRGERGYLRPEEVVAIARAGAAAGCREALFTLGDKPELRYRAAREELAALGHQTTVSYLAEMAALVLRETGLLPHLNPGVMSAREIAQLRGVSVSQGLMLETAADRLSQRGGPHFGSPDKRPAARLQMIAAGEAAVPFTSGILIGIGETRGERLAALLQLRDLHARHGHLQEIIIQVFRAKPETRMANHPEPDLLDHLWTIAAARIVLGQDMNIQAPPNLTPGALPQLVAAGINDWGGVSPVTPDHVNPERPWPEIDRLERETAKAGKVLVERLAIYPAYARDPDRWLAPGLRTVVRRASDAEGFARVDRWSPGTLEAPRCEPRLPIGRSPVASLLDRVSVNWPQHERQARCAPSPQHTRVHARLRRAMRGEGWGEGDSQRAQCAESPPHPPAPARATSPRKRGEVGASLTGTAQARAARPRSFGDLVLSERALDRAAGCALGEDDIVALFASRGEAFHAVCAAADALRASACGDVVSYVVTRNINYTNVCYFRCKFCAFSKGRLSENLRGRPYDLGLEEIQRRTIEAWDRGAVEVCLQGGIHPDYDGTTYLAICRAIKDVCPAMHIHAFSPLEVWQGAASLGVSVRDYLNDLKAAGLGSMPGTAAEVLDDEVRAVICPDKVTTAQWLDVVETAHRLGIRTTATIMFGHVDGPRHWARHLLAIRDLQIRTGGFTEFVPLPFVPMETPIHLHGRSRLGPTFREAVLMHAVARLTLHPHLTNIQTSWVKMGKNGAAACLQAGANDLGGTLMNESITRAAGAVHGQEMPPEAMEALIRSIGRQARQRTTLYAPVAAHRSSTSFSAAPLLPTAARSWEVAKRV